MGLFDQEVAVITGAAQGIGYEIASRLAAEGAAVVINDLDEEQAKTAAEQIIQQGGKAFAIAGNASDPTFLKELVAGTVSQFGKLSLAVANAGMTINKQFLEYTPEDLQKVMSLNLTGTYFLVQAAAMQMIRQQQGGSILLMSSVNAHQANKGMSAYAMTKAGIEMLAKNLVLDLSPHKITINAVAPGATLTERTLHQISGYADRWAAVTPMGRPASVADIAYTAQFLLSPQARHITGQTVIVDGGWTATSPAANEF